MPLQRISDLTAGTPPYSGASLVEVSVPTGSTPPYISRKAQLSEIAGGISGMAAGQIPIAASATTVTSSANLSGDVVSNATLATTIANNAVTTTKVLNANITYAKLQNVAASRILGNPTGSAAAPSEISLGTSMGFAGTVLNAPHAVSVSPAIAGFNTTSTTYVMAGRTVSITPATTGRLLIIATGYQFQATAGAANYPDIQLAYGTGTAPIAGAAATGTATGNRQSPGAGATGQDIGWTCMSVVTGLVVGTPYWVDLQAKINGSGQQSLVQVNIAVVEL